MAAADRAVEPAPAPQPSPPPAPAPAASLSDAYRLAVFRALRAAHRFPDAARARGEQGTVLVRFSVSREGRVTGARLERSSGYQSLDEAAVALPLRLSLPPLPAEFAASSAEFVAPINYLLR